MKIDLNKISHELFLQDGSCLVLLDCLDDPKSYPKGLIYKNLFKLDASNQVLWRVQDYKPMSNSTFTNLYEKEGYICAYNFDGIEYVIDPASELATPRMLLK